MEFFILGFVVGFIVTLVARKDIKRHYKRIIGTVFGLHILGILIIGLFRMHIAPSIELDKVAAETINSLFSHWVKHFLFDLGGFIAGIMIGLFTRDRFITGHS